MKKSTELKISQYEVGGKDLGDLWVNMSNALVRAAQGLTLAEKRVMAAAVAKMDSARGPVKFLDPPKIRLSAAEFAETFAVDPTTAYEQLKEAGDHLFNRYIRVLTPAKTSGRGPKKAGAGKAMIEHKFRWVGSATYHSGEGWIELAFWHEVVPHLMMLRQQFTSYKLSQASALRSVYSWRLLELLSQFKSTGWLRIDIEEFAHAMDAPASYKKDFKALRIRVVEPAVHELINKDGILIEWEPVRAGRKVTGLEFKFRSDPQGKLAL